MLHSSTSTKQSITSQLISHYPNYGVSFSSWAKKKKTALAKWISSVSAFNKWLIIAFMFINNFYLYHFNSFQLVRFSRRSGINLLTYCWVAASRVCFLLVCKCRFTILTSVYIWRSMSNRLAFYFLCE